jgi:F-box-like
MGANSSWTPALPKPDLENVFQSLTLADGATQASSITPTWSTSRNIDLLPHELIAEIFATTCHADSYTFLTDRNRHKRTTPLILGHVCTQWRAIAWSTPYIWSHISLSLSTPRYETQVKLLSDWLTRSGICPLTINFTFDHENEWTAVIPIDLIRLFVASANRWRSINFVLPESWHSILAELKCNFPLLVTVVSQPLWADCGLSPSKRKRLNLFEFAPLLRVVHVNGYYLSDVDIPWTQLDQFTLQHVYLDECFYALVKTPNITFCRIYTILVNDVDRDIIDKAITLPLLKELVIYSAHLTDISRLLVKMTVPLLETLEISAPQIDVFSEPIDLSALFLCNPKCHLKRLRLSEWLSVCAESEFIQHLRALPSLEELDIDMQPCNLLITELPHDIDMQPCNFPITELPHDILELAKPNSSPSDDDMPFLPNLQIFKFSGPIVVTNTDYDDNLTSLIEKRLDHSKRCLTGILPISRLKVFEVITEKTYPFTPSPSVKQRLSKLAAEGLRLEVKFSETPWF